MIAAPFPYFGGKRRVAVMHPAGMTAGTIACPTAGIAVAYVLDKGEPPARGYTRHREHTHRSGT